MSEPGILLLLFIVVVAVAVHRSLRSQREHRLRAQRFQDRFSTAKKSGNLQRIIQAGRAIVDEFTRSNRNGLERAAEELYRDVLTLSRTNPELRPFALEMGRVAYGAKRKEGKLTVYDEQAITNDLNAHQ